MKRYIQGQERSQVKLLPECLDDYKAQDNAVHVVDIFVDLPEQGAMHDQQQPAHQALGA